MSVHASASAAKSPSNAKAANAIQSLTALCLGLLIIGVVGFSHIEVVHNAAHDTRHANAFPCH